MQLNQAYEGTKLVEDVEKIEPCTISCPKPINPVTEMRQRIYRCTTLPNVKKCTPTPSKCGLGKKQGVKGYFRNMPCDSMWEAAWYIYMVDMQGNNVTRNTKDFFKYTNEAGEDAKFYPDFKMQGTYHEVKGIFRTNDLLKKEATLGLVTFWGPKEMKEIIKEVYKFNPNWKEEYVEISHGTKYGK